MTREIKKIGVVALLVALCLTMFTACGSPKTLEDAFKTDEVQEQISSLEGSGITITAEDNTLVYTYTYDDTYDFSDASVKEQVVSLLESGTAGYESTFESVASGLEEQLEIDGISVKVAYLESNGDVLYEHTFEF